MKKLYKRTLSLLFSMVFILGFALTPSAHVYPDTEFHWAKSYIDAVTNEGLLSARSTGFFVPDIAITRAEAVNALYVLSDAYLPRESIDETGFTDVPVTHTYASAITWSKQRGIMLGTSEDEAIFSPNTQMNREQFCVLVYRLFTANELSMTSIYTADITPNIPDENSISGWALTAVRTLYICGLISGCSDGNFNPTNSMSRGEACVLLSRILNFPEVDNAWYSSGDAEIGTTWNARNCDNLYVGNYATPLYVEHGGSRLSDAGCVITSVAMLINNVNGKTVSQQQDIRTGSLSKNKYLTADPYSVVMANMNFPTITKNSQGRYVASYSEDPVRAYPSRITSHFGVTRIEEGRPSNVQSDYGITMWLTQLLDAYPDGLEVRFEEKEHTMVFYKSNFQYGSMPSQYQNLFEVYDPASRRGYHTEILQNNLYELQNFTETVSYVSSGYRLSDIQYVAYYENN